MYERLKGALAVLALAAAALTVVPGSAMAQQQERPKTIAGKPNLNGIWQVMNSANWNLEAHNARALTKFWQLGAVGTVPGGLGVVEGGTIPYLPEALKQRNENRANWPDADPETSCYLPGIPRATYMPYPFQIVQGGGDIYFAYEYHSTNRNVHMAQHREPPIDTWMGESNGHWDGDTLVVVTTGFNGKTWLDRSGNFAGKDAKVTERFTLTDPDHMAYEATIENSKVFSRPWKIKMTLYRHVEPNAELMDFRCVEFVEKKLYHDLEETAPKQK